MTESPVKEKVIPKEEAADSSDIHDEIKDLLAMQEGMEPIAPRRTRLR